jgi:hypothetical protein
MVFQPSLLRMGFHIHPLSLYLKPPVELCCPLHPRVHHILNFFLFASKRIKANMDLIRFIFAFFGIFAYTIYSNYLPKFTSKYSNSQNKYTLKQMFASERIFASHFLIRAYIRFKTFAFK